MAPAGPNLSGQALSARRTFGLWLCGPQLASLPTLSSLSPALPCLLHPPTNT